MLNVPSHQAAARPATASTQEIDLPLRQLPSGQVVVEVFIGDSGPYDFVIDTGASLSVISHETWTEIGQSASGAGTARAEGATGTSEVKVLTLDSLILNGQEYLDHQVAVAELSHLAQQLNAPFGGILGANFLTLHLVDIDFVEERFRLWRTAPRLDVAAGSPAAAVRFQSCGLASGLICFAVELEGHPITCVLDLGASCSIVTARAAELGTSLFDASCLQTGALLGAGSSRMRDIRPHQFRSLRIGAATLSDLVLYEAELPFFSLLDLNDSPAMLLGVDLLRRFRVIINYPAGLLFISPASTADQGGPERYV